MKIFKLGPILLLSSIAFLLMLGVLNLSLSERLMHQKQMDNMILNSSDSVPMFYLSRFLFPEIIEIPFASSHSERFIEPLAIFPASLKVTKALTNSINGNDAVIIEYHGNENRDINKCDGTPLKPSETTENIYFISKTGDLSCAEIINNSPDYNLANIIVKNVDAMRILYGMDIDNDFITDYYTTANAANFKYEYLSSIKISLLIKTVKKEDSASTQKIYPLGNSQVGPFSDDYVRRTLTMVIPIKHPPIIPVTPATKKDPS